jgi:hypothetical protein
MLGDAVAANLLDGDPSLVHEIGRLLRVQGIASPRGR